MHNLVVFAYSLNENIKPVRKLAGDAGRALLFYGLDKMGIKPKGEILLTPNGKPYFEGNPVYFNISHSFDKVVVAIFRDRVGVDIEIIRENKEKIARRFFHEKEWEYLSKISIENYPREFTKIWTKKESYIKMTGEGFKRPLNSFNVLSNSSSVYFKEIEVFDGYKCHLCTEYPVEEELFIVERLEGTHD